MLKRALEVFRKKEQAVAVKPVSIPILPNLGPFEAVEPAPAPSAPAQLPDEFYLSVRCAVSGYYSRALYGRIAGGMYVPKSPLTKVVADRANAQGPAAGPLPEIPASAMSALPGGPCLWCGGMLEYSRIMCGRCKRLVCTGRSYREGGEVIFVCHEDCGESGPVSGSSVTSYGVEPNAPSGSDLLPPPQQPRQSLSPPGKGIVLKGK